ncbi:MAG: type II secretion system F family protein [Planctomycetaceae bacterium]|nr:type II secretion system F family protein [Planctomycetaceae bacterium]
MEPDRTLNVIVSLSVFGLAFSIWCIGVLIWVGRYLLKLKAVQKRLRIAPDASARSETLRLWRDMQFRHEAEQFSLERSPSITERLNCWVQEAGWKIPFRMVALIVLCLVVLVFLITYGLSNGVWLSVATASIVFYLFLQYVDSRILKRANLFERQLVDGLGVAARALRAGHPLVGAFQLISEEIGDPLGNLFGNIYHQQAFGSDLRESIREAARHVRNTEFKLFATSISVQLHSGGNLADLMDSLSAVIRDRMRLNKRIRVLTAQTQMSKTILIVMPIVLFIILNVLNREYMEPLYTTPEGNIMMVVMIAMILVGSWVMNRMIRRAL